MLLHVSQNDVSKGKILCCRMYHNMTCTGEYFYVASCITD